MKKENYLALLIVIAIIIVPNFISAQEKVRSEPWDFSEIPARGLYKNFLDLKYNRALPDSFIIKKDDFIYDIVHPTTKKTKPFRDIYAFSDGKAVFIKLQYGYSFHKVKIGSRYFFITFDYTPTYFDNKGLAWSSFQEKTAQYVIDLYTGRELILNKRNMKYILSDYPDLWKNYKAMKKNVTYNAELIKIVNQRYREGIMSTKEH